MRRVLALMPVVGLAVVLVLVLQWRKQVFIGRQVERLQSQDAKEATAARNRLQRVGRSAVRPVCALLAHEDEQVRARAALALANIGHAAACGPLMGAAKRGDFPAADALEFMRHPRANESAAWAWWRLGELQMRELEMCSPVGGSPPTAPLVGSWRPEWPFVPVRSGVTLFPKSLEWRWVLTAMLARGGTERASESFAHARALWPELPPARAAIAEERRRTAMERKLILASWAGVESFVGDETWRAGDAKYYVGIVGFPLPLQTPRSVLESRPWPTEVKLVAFRLEGRPVEKATVTLGSSVLVSSQAEMRALVHREAYLGRIRLRAGEEAAPVVIRAMVPKEDPAWNFYFRYDITVYRLDRGVLSETIRVPSGDVPCIGDLDGDGDAEIVTWRRISDDEQLFGWVPPWPIVRTLVDGRYEERTEEFWSLFADVAEALERVERSVQTRQGFVLPDDPCVPEYLGRAYELLGEKEKAIAAYRSAESRHLDWAGQEESRRVADRARRHREAAVAMRQRRVRLEAQEEIGSR